ncbi:APC family permease [Microbaculum marinisediminis]|uniref:APC family permease n=1 Tax=Microbaculum marinisediminis TaxID=2931392 RepID=A0AAW5R0V9_9HYPH|nr:APC family permease [Microbaculum sp. A6E488]MCT8973916.1 APC family permease [Microbaculum sp. A6E488]
MANIENNLSKDFVLTSSNEGMGPLELAFFVVAAAGPLLVVAGFAPLAFMIGGIGAPGAQLFAGLVLLLFAVGFTRMAMRVHNRGAFYAYIGKSLGKVMGGGAAALATAAYCVITFGQLGAFGAFASGSMSRLAGIEIDWVWFSLGAWALVAFLGYQQISLSAKVLGVALISEVLILVVLAVPVLLSGGPEGFTAEPILPTSIFGGLGTGAMFAIVFGAFIGFESTAVYAEEARNPGKTVPQATFMAVGFLTVFYGFMAWVAVVAFGESQVVAVATESPTEMFFIATERYVGHGATIVMELLLITSTFASSLAFHNTGSRYLFTLSREGLLPAFLGRINQVNRSPQAACLTVSAIALAVVLVSRLVGLDPYLELFLIAVAPSILAIIVLQLICSVAILVYFRTDKTSDNGVFVTTIAPVLSMIGLAVATWLITVNFSLLSGREGVANVVILSSLPIVFLIGMGRTIALRRSDPERYGRLTETKIW